MDWRHNPAANADDTGFTGHIRDTATGLTYAQARYYDPAIGRFLSNDPVGFAEGGWQYFNRYSYTFNDPVNYTDPTGEFGVKGAIIGGIIGGLGNAGAYALTAGDSFTWGGLAAKAVEGAVVGATIGSGAGLVTSIATGAGANVVERMVTTASQDIANVVNGSYEDAGSAMMERYMDGATGVDGAVHTATTLVGDATAGALSATVAKVTAPLGAGASRMVDEVLSPGVRSGGATAVGQAAGSEVAAQAANAAVNDVVGLDEQ